MTEKQPHAVNKRDRPTYQISESHTLAHTHSWLPETNKYKHDLALSPRKITVVSRRTVRTAWSQTLTPTRAPAAESAGCEEEALELEGLTLREIRRKAVMFNVHTMTRTMNVSRVKAPGHTSHAPELRTLSARSVRLASQLTGLWLHFSACV